MMSLIIKNSVFFLLLPIISILILFIIYSSSTTFAAVEISPSFIFLTFIITMICLALVYYNLYCFQAHENLPPQGPRGWPFINNVFQLGDQPYKRLVEIGKEYGDIFTLYFGSQRVIVINDPKLIQEAFSKLEFCGRPVMKHDLERMGGARRGLIFTNGPTWLHQRRFILQHLKGFGFGKMNMEGLILSEIQELLQEFHKTLGTPIKIQHVYYRSVLNAVWLIVAGCRFPHDDARFQSLQGKAAASILSARILGMLGYTPWLLRIHEAIYGQNNSPPTAILDYIAEVIREHESSYIAGQLRDLIDVFLGELENIQDEAEKKEAEANLLIIIFDLFVSSPHSVNFVLTWITILFALHPNVQTKVQDEILNVVGSSGAGGVPLSEKLRMPYTIATIREVLRYTAKTSMNGSTFHYTTAKTSLGEFNIPKDTIIIPNFYYSMTNPTIFRDPWEFKPERFLDDPSEPSSCLVKYESYMPFSTGKRDCIGKSMAMDELFLYVTNIFAKYRVELDGTKPPPQIDYEKITLLNPSSIPVIFHELLSI